MIQHTGYPTTVILSGFELKTGLRFVALSRFPAPTA
jgi:hypothetical protein